MNKIRPQYDILGVEGYYQCHGATYRNPHEKQIHVLLEEFRPLLDCTNVLDLACGSGEVSLKLLEFGATPTGLDPFTAIAYQQRTGLTALIMSFEDIAKGCLSEQHYSCIVCSFALHLADTSRLPLICYQLATISPKLLILSPHKRPILKSEWGWQLETEQSFERIKGKLYRSHFFK
jgi:2-polyprenyl-3-methyl-5-hydroxy-6-metoxy-1,4-benzoquinol methylase